uniref:Uncharacterized protein n=2 Tax=Pseudomonas TaxID=286 RepID=Q847I9_PSEPU|nr:unknown [Pseudomonas putida]ACQ63500.1 hypothetical protein [Pseudomonas fluorescens]BAF30945.1 transposase [uncultured bacterium]
MFLQQPAEVGDGGLVRNALQAQPGKLAQDGRLVQRFLHRRVAVAEPLMHQMNPQHCRQWIGWRATLTLGVMRIDQGNQTLPRHHPIHLDQEQLFAGLFALTGILGVEEGHLLHWKTRRVKSGHFAKIRKSSSEFP